MRVIALFLLALMFAWPAHAAQMLQPIVNFGGPRVYKGPGDIVPGAIVYYGLRAYSRAAGLAGLKAVNMCTAADALCGDATVTPAGDLNVGAGIFIGCVTPNVCTIPTWYCQNDGGNCGNDAVQATIANRATISFSCTTRSQPCATFVAASSQFYVSTSTITRAQPFTFVVWVNITANASFQTMIASSGANPALNETATANQWRLNNASSLSVSGVTDGAWHSGIAIGNGASSNLAVDGTSHTGNSGANGFSAVNVVLGATAGPISLLNGLMSEAGLWPGTFTTQQIATMNSDQKGYW